MVQDTFLRWQQASRTEIRNPNAWLTKTCTRRCLDLRRGAHQTRVDYVGTWLPEPVLQKAEDATTDESLASTLSMAFLLLLERLTPKERAAYLLYELFDTPYSTIAEVLELSESACRQLVARARRHVGQEQTRASTPMARQEELLTAFCASVRAGDATALMPLLAADVRLIADGGGKAPALRRTLRGRAAVAAFVEEGLHQYWQGHQWQMLTLNGGKAFALLDQNRVTATVSFGYNRRGTATELLIMRNPDKLTRLQPFATH